MYDVMKEKIADRLTIQKMQGSLQKIDVQNEDQVPSKSLHRMVIQVKGAKGAPKGLMPSRFYPPRVAHLY